MKQLLILLFSASIITVGFTAVSNLLGEPNGNEVYYDYSTNSIMSIPDMNDKSVQLPVYKGVTSASDNTQSSGLGVNISMESVNSQPSARAVQSGSLPQIEQNTVGTQGLSFESEKKNASASSVFYNSGETGVSGTTAYLAQNYSGGGYSNVNGLSNRLDRTLSDNLLAEATATGNASPDNYRATRTQEQSPVPGGVGVLLAFGLLYILFATARNRKGATV